MYACVVDLQVWTHHIGNEVSIVDPPQRMHAFTTGGENISSSFKKLVCKHHELIVDTCVAARFEIGG